MTLPIHAIFQRQISGDSSLLRLAQERFRAAGLGPEFYPGSTAELRAEQKFHPRQSSQTSTVHLPRDLGVFGRQSHNTILDFSAACGPSVRGMVLHDQPEVASRPDEYVRAVKSLDRSLRDQGTGPMLFIEYAWGLEIAEFVRLFERVRDCPRIGACIDIGHIGIRESRRAFERLHPGVDVCQIKPNDGLRERIEDVQRACTAGLPAVLAAVEGIGALGKPLHFHLHDGHPCSPFSAHGVSDHLSFGREIPIPFSHRGESVLPPLYGPAGLGKIIAAALKTPSAGSVTLTLEIHAPVPAKRSDLGEYGHLFHHWLEKRNAEQMNHWIDVLLKNHRLLRELLE